MSETTSISWTDHTANFWIGCAKVSAGCAKCYAETFVSNRMGMDVWGDDKSRHMAKGIWAKIKKWNRESGSGDRGKALDGRHLVFVGSLMDWAEGRSDLAERRELIWQAIRESPHLIFQMLTKRPGNIVEFLPSDWGRGYENVWLGTSIEDMRVAIRADWLRQIPAVVRFISYEPSLGPLDDLNLKGIDWVIQGGESGSGYREMPIEWALSMKAKCELASVAYFFKQNSGNKSGLNPELDGKIIQNFPTPRKNYPTLEVNKV